MEEIVTLGQLPPMKKSLWARGIVLQFLLKAIKVEAKYNLRFFSVSASELYQVESPKEAKVFYDELVEYEFCGDGTKISRALYQAITDMDSVDATIAARCLILITDGEDYQIQVPPLCEALAKNNVELYSIAINPKVPPLLRLISTKIINV